MKSSIQVMVVLALLMAMPRSSAAEPIRLGNGSAFVVTDFRSTLDGSFSNFGVFLLPPDIITGVFGREVVSNARTGCQPCLPLDTLNLGGTFELRGPSYRSAGDTYSVYGTGTLNFRTDDVVVPDTAAVAAWVWTRFAFDGVISLYRNPGDLVLFEGPIVGEGLARAVLYSSDGGRSRVFHQLLYEFGRESFDPNPAPVPEPATLLLCAGGLAVVARRAARRRV